MFFVSTFHQGQSDTTKQSVVVMSDSELSSVDASEDYLSQEEDEFREDEDEDEEDNGAGEEEDDDFEQVDDRYDDDDDDDLEEDNERAVAKRGKRKLQVKLTLSKGAKKATKGDGKQPKKKQPKTRGGFIRVVPRMRRTVNTVTERQPTRTSGRSTKKTTSYAESYDDDFEDESEYGNDENDVIPTPALDEEDLSEDDEEATPSADVTKMTERQRAMFLSEESETPQPAQLISLSNGVSKKRVLSEEENQLRKAEIARKRKNLSEKKLEEEKQDTINKLLKRRAGKASSAQLEEDEENLLKDKPRRPQLEHKALFTWVSKGDSLALRVPDPLL